MKKISFVILALLLLVSCGDFKSQMKEKAKENLVASMDYPKQLKISAISEPDSAYGVSYFSKKEMTSILTLMSRVTNQLMEKTKDVEDFSRLDPATMSLARRQMTAANEVQDMIFKNVPKGEWSGWKVKIDYQCADRNGVVYRAERWVFFDRKGKDVVKIFEIPLP